MTGTTAAFLSRCARFEKDLNAVTRWAFTASASGCLASVALWNGWVWWAVALYTVTCISMYFEMLRHMNVVDKYRDLAWEFEANGPNEFEDDLVELTPDEETRLDDTLREQSS